MPDYIVVTLSPLGWARPLFLMAERCSAPSSTPWGEARQAGLKKAPKRGSPVDRESTSRRWDGADISCVACLSLALLLPVLLLIPILIIRFA